MTEDRLTGPARSGERKLVTLLFADLSGYTALVASMDPEEAYAFVRPGMAGLQRIVEDHGGTVPQVMGDGFMAVFGVPAAHEDDAERAARVGLAVRDHARELRRRGTGTPFPEIHAGITSGEVMVAPSGEAAGFAVVGDAVNTASRLADQARPGQVLVDDGTRRRTLHAIRYGPGDSYWLKGKASPMEAFEAVEVRTAAPAGRATPAVSGGFVDRERGLETLGRALGDTVRQRRSSVPLSPIAGAVQELMGLTEGAQRTVVDREVRRLADRVAGPRRGRELTRGLRLLLGTAASPSVRHLEDAVAQAAQAARAVLEGLAPGSAGHRRVGRPPLR